MPITEELQPNNLDNTEKFLLLERFFSSMLKLGQDLVDLNKKNSTIEDDSTTSNEDYHDLLARFHAEITGYSMKFPDFYREFKYRPEINEEEYKKILYVHQRTQDKKEQYAESKKLLFLLKQCKEYFKTKYLSEDGQEETHKLIKYCEMLEETYEAIYYFFYQFDEPDRIQEQLKTFAAFHEENVPALQEDHSYLKQTLDYDKTDRKTKKSETPEHEEQDTSENLPIDSDEEDLDTLVCESLSTDSDEECATIINSYATYLEGKLTDEEDLDTLTADQELPSQNTLDEQDQEPSSQNEQDQEPSTDSEEALTDEEECTTIINAYESPSTYSEGERTDEDKPPSQNTLDEPDQEPSSHNEPDQLIDVEREGPDTERPHTHLKITTKRLCSRSQPTRSMSPTDPHYL